MISTTEKKYKLLDIAKSNKCFCTTLNTKVYSFLSKLETSEYLSCVLGLETQLCRLLTKNFSIVAYPSSKENSLIDLVWFRKGLEITSEISISFDFIHHLPPSNKILVFVYQAKIYFVCCENVT